MGFLIIYANLNGISLVKYGKMMINDQPWGLWESSRTFWTVPTRQVVRDTHAAKTCQPMMTFWLLQQARPIAQASEGGSLPLILQCTVAPFGCPRIIIFFTFMILHVYWVSFFFNCDDFSPVFHRFLIRDHTVEHGRCSNGGPFALPATVIRRMPGRLADQWHGQVKIVSGWHEIGSRFTNTKTHI